jgi:hypothetical protein
VAVALEEGNEAGEEEADMILREEDGNDDADGDDDGNNGGGRVGDADVDDLDADDDDLDGWLRISIEAPSKFAERLALEHDVEAP